MSASIQLPFWPSTLDNIRWSNDDLIAISGGEHIFILVPQLRSKLESDPKWQVVNIKVVGFIQQDVPLISPLSRKNWSLGEELSQQHVLDHAWSSPDLGEHGSCVLAILHANHVLTIWEYRGRPIPNQNWRRACILNHILQDRLGCKTSSEDQITEEQQIRQRVRAFAWLNLTAPKDQTSPKSNIRFLRARQFMAISNDDGEIFIVEVSSPYDILRPERKSWTAKILLEIDCNHAVKSSERTSNNLTMQRTRIDSLVWGNKFDGDKAVLFFIADHRLFSTVIKFEITSVHEVEYSIKVSLSKKPEQCSPTALNITTPLRCQPATNRPVYLTSDSLCTGDETEKTEDAGLVSIPIDTAWSEVSGLSVVGEQAESQTILMSSHLSNEDFQTPIVELTSSSPEIIASAPWQEVKKLAMSAYATDLDTTSGIMTRNWGLATSPTHELVATCTTMLPNESAVHIIVSDQVCTVDICENPEWNTAKLETHRKPVVSESLVRAIQNTEAKSIELLKGDLSDNEAKQYIQALLRENASTYQPTSEQELANGSKVMQAIYELKDFLSTDQDYQQLKIERLYSLILQQQPSTSVPKQAYSSLVDKVLSISSSLPPDATTSQKVLAVYRAAKQALASEEETTLPEENLERCNLCNDSIAFEAFKWARCASGHQFARCSSTLLAIPQPGISKSCGLCDAIYLDEHKIQDLSSTEQISTSSLQRNSVSTKDLSNSIARVLFAAADRCIFCGGKFVS